MQNSVVIVTRGGTGIRRATEFRFAQEGTWVLVVGRRSDPLEEVANLSNLIFPVVADIQCQADIAKIVLSAKQR